MTEFLMVFLICVLICVCIGWGFLFYIAIFAIYEEQFGKSVKTDTENTNMEKKKWRAQ